MIFKEVAKKFLENKSGEMQELSVIAYERMISKTLKVIGDKEIEDVACPECLNSIVRELEKKGYSENYISQIVSMVRYIVRFYNDMKLYEGVAKAPKRKPPKLFTDEEAKGFINIAKAESSDTNKVIAVALAMFAGLTVSEICALQWEDVDLTYNVILISKCVQRIPTRNSSSKTKLEIKGVSPRIVPINDSLLEFISKYKADSKREYVISGSMSITDPRSLEYYISNLFDGYAVLGDFRDWFCIKGIQQGIPIHILANYIGVSIIHFCTRYGKYLKFTEKDLKSEINKIRI